MASRFIDKFEVILLDVGLTFMFEAEGFDESSDFEASYRNVGGTELGSDEVFRIASAVIDTMLEDSKKAENYDSFASAWSYLESHPASCGLSEREKRIFEKVIAKHEIGIVSQLHIGALKELAKTHKLGVVSDIWSSSESILREFEQIGISGLFETMVFSSDIGAIKPSAKIFQKAADAFEAEKSKMVYIGDSLRRDVAGAKGFGISAIWIQNGQVFDNNSPAKPDLIVNDLRDVLFS